MTSHNEVTQCPQCGQKQVAVLETIAAWQWERPVYGCAACLLTFIGSWRNAPGTTPSSRNAVDAN